MNHNDNHNKIFANISAIHYKSNILSPRKFYFRYKDCSELNKLVNISCHINKPKEKYFNIHGYY